MKAVYQTKYGKSDVLKYGEQSKPEIKANEVRIKNHASSVNPRDWMIRSGRYQLQFLVPKFPLILGSDFAGEVLEVGAKVKDFKPGDKVFGMKNPSEGLATYAEEVAAPAKNMTLIPKGLSYTEAAGVPLCSLTAWQALVQKACLKKRVIERGKEGGVKVLIIGASGGVGSFGVQIAKALGGDVTAVCSQKNEVLVTNLGASKVIDYHLQDFVKGNDCYDIIFDTVGRHDLNKCAAVLKPGGTYVSTVPSPTNLKAMAITTFKSLLSQATNSQETKKARVVMVRSDGRDLAEVAKLIFDGRIRSVVDQVYPLQQADQAHDYSRSLRAKGKIILEIQ
jgi:NADPH:quinone reductase-like Zn-dependent oxidoreductase